MIALRSSEHVLYERHGFILAVTWFNKTIEICQPQHCCWDVIVKRVNWVAQRRCWWSQVRKNEADYSAQFASGPLQFFLNSWMKTNGKQYQWGKSHFQLKAPQAITRKRNSDFNQTQTFFSNQRNKHGIQKVSKVSRRK